MKGLFKSILPILAGAFWMSTTFNIALGADKEETSFIFRVSAANAFTRPIMEYMRGLFNHASSEVFDLEYEQKLIQVFKESGQEDPNLYQELVNRLLPHLFYTEDAESRNDDFMRNFIRYYSPGSTNYEILENTKKDVVQCLIAAEELYQMHINPLEEEQDEGSPTLAVIDRLMEAQI